MVIDHIDGRTFTETDVRAELPRVAELIRTAHREVGRHLRGPALSFWTFHVLRNYVHALADGGHRLSAELPRLSQVAERLEAIVGPTEVVFAHNDLLPGNFIDDGKKIWRVNDHGQDACSFWFPDMKRVVWTSTRDNMDMPVGDWSDAANYPDGAELYSSDPDGKNVNRLTFNKDYEAEVAVSPDGKWLVFGRERGLCGPQRAVGAVLSRQLGHAGVSLASSVSRYACAAPAAAIEASSLASSTTSASDRAS